MKYLLFFNFLLISLTTYAQKLDDIEDLIHQCLKKNGAIYRGLSLSINFERNEKKWSISTYPVDVVDSEIVKQIELASNITIRDTSLSTLIGYVKFDDYSSDIFVNESRSEELINHSYALLEPVGALEAFVNRWYDHLDSCKDLVRDIEGQYLSFLSRRMEK